LRWLESILNERFGHSWKLTKNGSTLELSLDGETGKIVFDNLSKDLTEAHSNQPCSFWDAKAEGWNSVLGEPLPAPGFEILPSPLIEQKDKHYLVHYDILGLTYWMLARIEELERTKLDKYGRFSAYSSNAYIKNYLNRPVVDEWLFILEQVISILWINKNLKIREYKKIVTCDVDYPLDPRCTFKNITRLIVRNIIKDRSLKLILKNILNFILRILRIYKYDYCYNGILKLINNVNENAKLSFYFIPRSFDDLNCFANIKRSYERKILNYLHKNNIDIGLHFTTKTISSYDDMRYELEYFKHVVEQEGINLKKFISRQHILAWKAAETPNLLDSNGIYKDSTLGYPECPGFRCGTCHEYKMYDPCRDKRLNLVQMPLIVMDANFCKKYNSRTLLDNKKEIEYILKSCQMVRGNFVTLWHNNNIVDKYNKEFFKLLVSNS
jgi:hypothetical protein